MQPSTPKHFPRRRDGGGGPEQHFSACFLSASLHFFLNHWKVGNIARFFFSLFKFLFLVKPDICAIFNDLITEILHLEFLKNDQECNSVSTGENFSDV